MKNEWTMWAVSALMLALLGCGKDGAWEPTMENPTVKKVAVCNDDRGLAELDDDDIVVAFNGIALRKRDITLKLQRAAWSLEQQRTVRNEDKNKLFGQFRLGCIEEFENKQALAWESRKLGCATRAEIVDYVKKGIASAARMYRKTPEQLDKELPGGLDGMREVLELECWANAYTVSNVPPLCVVTDEMVENVKRDFARENAVIEASNEVKRALLADIRNRIVAKGEDFGMLADRYTEDEMQEKDGTGYWGNFTRDGLKQDPNYDSIANLDQDAVSEILTDDEGYSIVKMMEYVPETKDEKGRVKTEASMKLGRIFLKAEETTELADPKHLKQDFQQQMREQAILKRTRELLSRGELVYPHGTNFWKQAKEAK